MNRSVFNYWCLVIFFVAQPIAFAQTQSDLDSAVRECAADGSPTFFPRQGRWLAEPDFSRPGPVVNPYYFDSQGAPGIGDDSEFDAVNAAFDAYNLHLCSGTVGSYPNLENQDAGLYDFSNQTLGGVAVDGRDELGEKTDGNFLVEWANVIRWVDSSEASAFSGGAQTLAVTTSTILDATRIAIQADIVFNGIDFDWRSDTQGCSPSSTCHDIRTVALHEVGHFIGLGHVDCADAIMYQFHKGTEEKTGLSENETAGLCALYPPRDFSISARVAGEQCDSDADCAGELVCALEPGVGSPFGVCSDRCESADCPDGYLCREHPDGFQFCAPGYDGADSGGTIDPGTGLPVDFCQPCSSGAQCSNGICAGTTNESAVCTQGCDAGSGLGLECPAGFVCATSTEQFPVCIPEDPSVCGGEDSRSGLNDICYAPGILDGGEDFLAPCQPGLACFGFAPICGSSVGACVVFCDAFERPYNGRACPEPSQTCCFTVDEQGNCVESPPAGVTAGGCFDLRSVGESCVVPENAVCEDGALCVAFQGFNSDRCYRECTSSSDCEAGNECRAFTDDCDNDIAVCCDSSRSDTCIAQSETTKSEIGVACRSNDECQSGLCIRIAGGQSACSRNCNPVTAAECPPDNADVNGDGRVDGPFECRKLDDQFYCWPENGPVLAATTSDDTSDSGGCSCGATTLRGGLVDWSIWLLIAVCAALRRRRRHA